MSPSLINARMANFLAMLCLLVLAVLLYRPGLVDLWVFDDHPALGPLTDDLRAERPLAELLARHAVSSSGPTGRPVSMLTFILDGVARGPDLAGWKATNLVLHLACGILVFLLVRELLGCFTGKRRGSALPLVVAALWLLHPLHVSTVLYTVQRMTLLSTLFQLAGLLGYLRGRGAFLGGTPARGWGWLGISAACLVLGFLSKETGVLLLVYVVLFEALCLAGGYARHPLAVRWTRRVLLLGVATGLAMAFAWFVLRSGSLLHGYGTRPFSLDERLWTQPRIMLEYTRLTLLPSLADMKFIHDDIEISRGWFTPWTTAAAVVLLALFAWSAWLARRRLPLYSFGAGLFLCGHLLESTVVPLDLMYEHRQYLPSLGLLLGVVGLGERLLTRRRISGLAVLLLLGLFSVMTWQRAAIWSSEARLFLELVRINGDSPRAMVMVANWFGNQGQYGTARALLERIDTPGARLNTLYYTCVESGALPPAALDALPEPRIVSFHEASGLMFLGRAGLAGSCRVPDQAYLDLLARWLARPVHASRSGLLIYRGYYLDRAGRIDEALATLEEAYRVGGRQSPVALVIAAELAIDAGRLEEAERLLERAREANRRSRRDSSSDIDRAASRLVIARERPEALQRFDPFKE